MSEEIINDVPSEAVVEDGQAVETPEKEPVLSEAEKRSATMAAIKTPVFMLLTMSHNGDAPGIGLIMAPGITELTKQIRSAVSNGDSVFVMYGVNCPLSSDGSKIYTPMGISDVNEGVTPEFVPGFYTPKSEP